MSAGLKHGRTRARIDNIKRLVAALGAGDMLRDDIGELFGFSPSGVRKYVKDLIEHQIIEFVRHVDPTEKSLGIPLYRLNPDALKVAAFLAALDLGQLEQPGAGRHTLLSAALADPSRHFHVLQDDEACFPRLHRWRIPAPDPLLAALFGLAGAQGEVHA